MGERYARNPNTRCSVCNKAIYRRPIELERTNGKVYCTQVCFGISSRREKSCVVCAKPILSSLHRKTCSRSCANTHRAGIRYKVGSPRDKVKDQRSIKLRVIAARGPECERCHFKKVEILHVHHKNRDRTNNSLENLELLCPNCHYTEHYLEKSWLNGKVMGD